MTKETFEETLNHRLAYADHPYRVRWSDEKQVWCIEQKMNRGVFDTPASRDGGIRLRDGYALVCEICPSPTFRCPDCLSHLPAPVLKFAEVKCKRCQLLGEKSLFFLGYFPFCDKLISHLEKTSPRRAAERARERDKENERIMRMGEKDYENRFDSFMRERHSSVVGIPSWGYTGPNKFDYR